MSSHKKDSFGMKKLVYFLFLIIVGCTSDIDILTENYKTVPVITALINPWDSIHTVRVQRSFLIRDKEGAQLQNSDSLYFKQVEVSMIGIKDSQEKFNYNFDKKSVAKDSGNFTGDNHHVFQLNKKLPIQLSGRSAYSSGYADLDYLLLKITINDLDTVISRMLPVYAPVKVYNKPYPNKVVIYGDYVSEFYCHSASRAGSPLINGELEFRFHISESGDNFGYDTVYTYKFGCLSGYRFDSPERLLNKIMMSLDLTRDDINSRVFHTMDLYWTLAEPDYFDFSNVSSYWQGMLDLPYSQVDGMYGLMVTKVDGVLEGLELDRRTMDSLCNGKDYKNLHFKYWGIP